ncbi:MAG: hypothetical protein KGK07_14785 [Chloroflexota bacterium]|nr:hypothetical protein [Chloroflexota bacterium]
MIIDLEAIEAAARGATPGPWFDAFDVVSAATPDLDASMITDCSRTRWPNQGDNAHYIATVSPDVALALVAELRRLRRVVAAKDGT